MRNSVLKYLFILSSCVIISGCSENNSNKVPSHFNNKGQPVYQDIPYLQDYSIKYYLADNQIAGRLTAISSNRDGQISILLDNKLLVPDIGSLFYSGGLIPDVSYPQTAIKNIVSISTYKNQTIYLDDLQLFSNAWAGKLQIDHRLPNASVFAGGQDFHFLVSDGEQVVYLDRDSHKIWSGSFKGTVQISYSETDNSFLLVSPNEVAEYVPGKDLKVIYKGSGITCAIQRNQNSEVVIGTKSGYISLSDQILKTALPCKEITCLNEIDGKLWFGTSHGAFMLNEQGKYNYYAGERWLPGNHVTVIGQGPENSVLVLTDKGLGQIFFKKMTLEDKALFYEKQVREKNIRYGFNCSSVQLTNGFGSAQTASQPSDNLWTGMYLAGQLFRYKVTGSLEAKENAFESFEAMERLFTVTGIQGLFARSYERDYKVENERVEGWQQKELLTGSPASLWLQAKDHPNWTWRSTASSDQAVGQVFALTAVLELSDDLAWKARALKCLDDLMGYIVKNDLYIIDVDGRPTMWGKWNPDYVNRFPKNVGDRKICSSNINALLQIAYKFTGKEVYKIKIDELIGKYGYMDNLMRPFSQIGASDQDVLSKVLSEEWNHSDDEMYFLAYWGLYPYALNPELKAKFAESIKDHWEIERPEQNALWNFTYAMTGAKDFDLEQSVRFLQTYPLDLRNWAVQNSQRNDLKILPPNFRGQTTSELLPLGEIPLYRHNGQIFRLDSEGDGKSLISAGDVWLLPYWMGRYLGVISAPINEKLRN